VLDTATATASGRDDSLRAVRAVIPADCYERPTARALGRVALAGGLHLLPLVGLAFTNRWYLVLPLWLLAGLGVSGLFVLAHDASHGALTANPKLNKWIARALMIPSAHVESAWDLGHNRIHHGYTTRQGFDFVWHPATVEEYQAMSRPARAWHRLAWSRVGAGAYYLREVWWKKMMRFRSPDKWRSRIRIDKVVLLSTLTVIAGAVATLGWVVDGGALGAAWMVVKLLVVPFLLFTHIIGMVVYVHHVAVDIRWWPRRTWSQFKGQMESTTIMRVPRVANLWLHNIMVHVPHHVDMRIPYHALPRAATAIRAAFPHVVRDATLSARSYRQSTRACKLYDFGTGTWLPYAAATRELS
jgi:omega-6 fatty acid desaturase (delta-12 desaturase)